ncbi:MAG TPA: DUF4097 family beta strand repeat-containing protein [Terriglobia bacterium]|nr:DUF4097 family beta strand repeat-containing protein [Terriglobia bacterium]
MKVRMTKLASILTTVILLAVAAIPAHGFVAEGSFDRTLKVTGAVDLDVATGSGNIDVRTGDSGSVHVRAKIRASNNWHGDSADAEKKVHELETNPPIEQNGNSIRIGHIEDPELRRNISISYELEVPAETRLAANTGSGNETISGIQGPLRANTGSGSLKISNIGDELDANSGSGDIEADSIKGHARVHTGSGWIHASGIAGAIVAGTGSGDIRLEQTAPGDVRVETGSGTTELTGVSGSLEARSGSGNISASGSPTGGWSMHSGSGTLKVHFATQVGFDLDAHTSSGQIITDQPITVQGTIGRGRMQGKARGGGVRLNLETGSGNIHIE